MGPTPTGFTSLTKLIATWPCACRPENTHYICDIAVAAPCSVFESFGDPGLLLFFITKSGEINRVYMILHTCGLQYVDVHVGKQSGPSVQRSRDWVGRFIAHCVLHKDDVDIRLDGDYTPIAVDGVYLL